VGFKFPIFETEFFCPGMCLVNKGKTYLFAIHVELNILVTVSYSELLAVVKLAQYVIMYFFTCKLTSRKPYIGCPGKSTVVECT